MMKVRMCAVLTAMILALTGVSAALAETSDAGDDMIGSFDQAELESMTFRSVADLLSVDGQFERILDIAAARKDVSLPEEAAEEDDVFTFVDRAVARAGQVLDLYGADRAAFDTAAAAWQEEKTRLTARLLPEAPGETMLPEGDVAAQPDRAALLAVYGRMLPEDRMACLDAAVAVYDAAWEELFFAFAEQSGLQARLLELDVDVRKAGRRAQEGMDALFLLRAGLRTGFDEQRMDLYLRMMKTESQMKLLLMTMTVACGVLDSNNR